MERAAGGFFGRRQGRPLRPGQAEALESGLSTYGIDLSTPAPAQIADLFGDRVDGVRLEIGFGGGEHLLFRAHESPKTGFIGVEPFVNGLAKVTAILTAQALGNVRLYGDDATELLDWLPPASLDGIDLFYPDPWPKKKHWKRRFVSKANLTRFARVLKSGAEFRFASDIGHYVNWTLIECRRHPEFEWKAQKSADWTQPYAGWPGTRYEAKAIREGRTPAYLTFVRT